MLDHAIPATRPAPAPGSAAEAFLSTYGFNCPVYKATLTAKGCEDNRNRSAEERKPGCGPECTVYLEKRGTWSRRTPETPAWLLVKSITGCNSFAALAESMGRKRDNGDIGRIFSDLERGRLPRGAVWNALLKFTKLNGSKLLNAGKVLPMVDDDSRAELFPDFLPPAPPASSLPTPSGPDAPSPAAPDGPAGHMMAMQDAPDDPVGDYVPLETEGEALAEGSGSPAAFEQGLFAETPETPQATAEACAALPADFLPYTGALPTLHGKPALHIKKGGDMELSADAVALGEMENAGHVRPFWSDQRKQIALAPVDGAGPGVLKLQVTPSKRRRISASGFLNGFDIRPAPGTYPMERHASGLLVATITQQPAQGGEA